MTYATTFSGIGGWELGLNACGWDLQWQCERDPFCRTLLKERFGVPVYDDITTICEHNPPSVDALIGSPPCQPFSVAGKKGGTSDERHLYPAFLALVGHIKPRWVLMEQVPAILSSERGRAFGSYIAGLAALGYSLVWHCIPACAVGANHQRDRAWILAHSECIGRKRGRPNQAKERSEKLDSGQPERFRKVSFRFPLSAPTPYGVANGIPNRTHRLKGLGNAIVPQIAQIIGQAINQIEQGQIE